MVIGTKRNIFSYTKTDRFKDKLKKTKKLIIFYGFFFLTKIKMRYYIDFYVPFVSFLTVVVCSVILHLIKNEKIYIFYFCANCNICL